ncbi:O-antigen ligase [Lacinutrix sp. Bg11-31]|uniref:O-antigen ligase family protein n=1 Tax=Lacinutrix sp. Bg11-31 TaxID=2057808 RepID=UPI000C3106D7|nr:O-antigen ligase family protein [Lacinutrix sp. Bg11-31]AUC82951.1 hypothetical protein CW733_12775 [Lacinutrix sp. Bg11-31]
MNYNKEIDYKSYLQTFLFSLFCLLFAFPILPNAFHSIIIVLIIISALFLYGKNLKDNIKRTGYKPVFYLCLWIIVIIFSLSYTDNQDKGLKLILRLVNFIIFPILFIYLIPKISQKQQTILFYFYIVSNFLIVIFLYVKLVQGIDALGYINTAGERTRGLLKLSIIDQFNVISKLPFHVSRYYLNENNISGIFVHKAYLSMGFIWSIILIIDTVFFKETSKWLKAAGLFFILIFTFSVVYLTSIPNLVCLLIIPIFIVWKINSKKIRTIICILFIVVPSILLVTPSVQNKLYDNVRFKQDFEEAKITLVNLFSEKPDRNANIRSQLWSCAVNEFAKKPIFGYGIGSENDVINTCTNSELNSHNYFFSILITGGLILFIAFILFLGNSFNIAIITKNKVQLAFLVIICINLMSESMFIRIHGILFCSIFGSLLYKESLFLKLEKESV